MRTIPQNLPPCLGETLYPMIKQNLASSFDNQALSVQQGSFLSQGWQRMAAVLGPGNSPCFTRNSMPLGSWAPPLGISKASHMGKSWLGTTLLLELLYLPPSQGTSVLSGNMTADPVLWHWITAAFSTPLRYGTKLEVYPTPLTTWTHGLTWMLWHSRRCWWLGCRPQIPGEQSGFLQRGVGGTCSEVCGLWSRERIVREQK